MRRFFVAAQRKKERQHFRDRKLLMHYEKQRAEMRKNMGLNPVLGMTWLRRQAPSIIVIDRLA